MRRESDDHAAEVRAPSAVANRLPVASLLCASGACALVYQVAWLRLLRLVFGSTTAATAAVLAIFLGGLGFGALVLGRRADRTARPLRLYAALELGVALAAAASPLLVMLVRHVYIALGGVQALGMPVATGLRLALAALVLGLPTFLMGGTLPAAVRAVEDASDPSRRRTGLLYSANTIGAVLGTMWATFVSLELLGTNRTVWCAAVANGVVALLAGILARRMAPRAEAAPAIGSRTAAVGGVPDGRARQPLPAAAPVPLVLAAAAVVGFAFLLMELVWYRMLAPLLGGSTYTFGLILAVALLGIGVGGLLYAAGSVQRQPTLRVFSFTCALEALCIVLPYAAGDRVALLTLRVQPPDSAGFVHVALAWALVTLVVVLPAAIIAGYQFPLLVALLGRGEHAAGGDVGAAYACNTLGAIAGSLAGGFGLLPWLSAPGVWRTVTCLLAGVAVVSLLQARRARAGRRWGVASAILAGLGMVLSTTPGPTAFWRHSPIGARRVEVSLRDPNDVERALRDARRAIIWERDGVESSVALYRANAYALFVNGKSDGNAIEDASAQVMSGLIGAILHPNLTRVLVIGLGTGSTAGWLAQLPSVERVDVVELEPAVVHVADVCSPVNRDVLSNPKVRVIIGDGRDLLLTTRDTYDLIYSEPSNPYRAGVASLLTQEFYQAVAARLRPDGVFAQWVQGYEIQPQTLHSVYATLGTALPEIETWEVGLGGDLLLVASRRPRAHDLGVLQARVGQEPYRSALALVWGVSGVEGLYSGFVGTTALADDLRHEADAGVNTDDDTILEYQFARSAGQNIPYAAVALRERAAASGQQHPAVTGGSVNWPRAEELRGARAITEEFGTAVHAEDTPSFERAVARQTYADGQPANARRHWLAQNEGPTVPADTTMVAEILADIADPRALPYIEAVRSLHPAEAEALLALFAERVDQPQTAVTHLVSAFETYRDLPWTGRPVMRRALALALRLATQHPELAAALLDALAKPFAVRALDDERMLTRAAIGFTPGMEQRCAAALAELEPNVPWDRDLLAARVRCYSSVHHPLEARARAELNAFIRQAPKAQ